MKYLLISLFLCAFISCNTSPESINDTSEVDNNQFDLDKAVENNTDSTLSLDEKYQWENTKVDFGTPIVLNSTDNIAIPIILDNISKGKMDVSYSYFNIAIIDGSNNFKKLLFEESVAIQSISTIEPLMPEIDTYYVDQEEEAFSELYNSLLFMTVSKFSKDSQVNAERLFVYNMQTDSLTQLTPDNIDVKRWHAYKNVSKIFVKVAPDTNENGEFDGDDIENVILVDPNNPMTSEPLFDLSELAKIKAQVIKED